MRTKPFISISLLSFSLLFFSCSSNTNNNASDGSELNEVEGTDATISKSKGRYAIKSGIVEYKTQIMGMDAKQTLYFDDYGRKEVQDTEMEMMGTNIHTVTITKDGFIYTLNMNEKTYTKISGTSPNIDFENLTEELQKDMNIRKEGTEEYLGKKCEKMSIDYKKLKLQGNYLVYKGVALMVDTDMGTMKIKLIGEKFTENPAIPSEKFEVPADFTLANQ